MRDGKRTYDWAVIIRVAQSKDAMAATVPEIPYEILKKITDRILSEIKDVNRVFYDLRRSPHHRVEIMKPKPETQS